MSRSAALHLVTASSSQHFTAVEEIRQYASNRQVQLDVVRMALVVLDGRAHHGEAQATVEALRR